MESIRSKSFHLCGLGPSEFARSRDREKRWDSLSDTRSCVISTNSTYFLYFLPTTCACARFVQSDVKKERALYSAWSVSILNSRMPYLGWSACDHVRRPPQMHGAEDCLDTGTIMSKETATTTTTTATIGQHRDDSMHIVGCEDMNNAQIGAACMIAHSILSPTLPRTSVVDPYR